MMSSANCIQEKFIDDLSKQIFPQRQCSELQKLCFQLRFHPRNWDFPHEQIAAKISKKLNGGFSENSMEPTVKTVLKKLKDKFESQMQADGVDTEKLIREHKGRPSASEESPWQIVYKWLWETEFPRRGWQLSKEIAVCAIDQLQMKPIQKIADGRDLNVYDIPDFSENYIQKEQPYRLQISLQPDGYLLLINQGISGKKYGLCPSKAYAPHNDLAKSTPMYLPQPDALVKKPLIFNAAGEEYFLAIVTEQPLNLSWVRPDSAPKDDIELNKERLQEIFKQLGQQPKCEVLYKNFVVKD